MPAFNPLYKDNIDSFSFGASRGFQLTTGDFFFGEYDTGTISDYDTTVRPIANDYSLPANNCKTIQNLIDDGVITNSTSSTARNYVSYTIISPVGVGGAAAPYVEFGVGFIRRSNSWPYPHELVRTTVNGQGYLIYQKNPGTEAGTFPRLRGNDGGPTSYNVYFGFPQTRAVYSGNHHAAPTMEGIATEVTLALDLYSR
jgi:hypothetical protein